jgi:signal transduction histidine kinase
MNPVSLLHAGKDQRLRSVLAKALPRAFPGSVLAHVDNLTAAFGQPMARDPEVQVLALEHPTAADLDRAQQAADDLALPRWTVVVFGPATIADAVPPEDWTEARIVPVLRAAVAGQVLRRENARLRGEFRTIGSRLNHDLRTPLSCILTMTELVGERLGQAEPEPSRLLHPIVASVDDSVRLIERLSLLAKATGVSEELESCNMGVVFSCALLRREAQIADSGVSVEQPPKWPTIKGHAALLESVWLDLLDNALRHGGKAIAVGWEREKSGWRFWMRDSGPPLGADRQADLFQPLHLLHRENAVSGLGLAIIRRLVELHGGHCGYEILPDGARFYFTLPEPVGAR